jgi:hypothetical protein
VLPERAGPGRGQIPVQGVQCGGAAVRGVDRRRALRGAVQDMLRRVGCRLPAQIEPTLHKVLVACFRAAHPGERRVLETQLTDHVGHRTGWDVRVDRRQG